jgi:hypothetical protein
MTRPQGARSTGRFGDELPYGHPIAYFLVSGVSVHKRNL